MKSENRNWGQLQLIFSLIAGITIIAHFIASFFPSGRTWGFHHLLFFPLWVRVSLTFIGLLICVPGVNKHLSFFLQVMANFLFRKKRLERYIIIVSLSFLSFIVFWLLRTKTHFLGDGYLRIRGLEAGNIFSTVEPLDTYLHFIAHKFFNILKTVDPTTTYAILSCSSGALLVFIILIVSGSWTKNPLQATFISFSVVTMGLMQLFFGYVENYTLMTTGMLLYIMTSLLYLNKKCDIALPSFCLSLTICLHTVAFPLVGSLAYLIFAKTKARQKNPLYKNFVKSIAAFSLPLIGLSGMAIHLGYGPNVLLQETGQQVFLPLLNQHANSTYSILSVAHLFDFINEQILISPAGIMIFVLIFKLRKKINFSDKTLRFLIIASSCLLLFTFALNPKLGLSRDWDLFSVPGLSYTILALYLAISYIKDNQILKSIGTVCIVVNLLHTVPWILVNAHENKSIERFKLLVQTKKVSTLYYAYEELGTYFRDTDKPENAIDYYKKAIEVSPGNWRLHNLLGSTFSSIKRYDEAILEFEVAKKLAPKQVSIYHNLGLTYMHKGNYDMAINELRNAIILDPKDPDKFEKLGEVFLEKKMYSEALDQFHRASDLDPDNSERIKRLNLLRSIAHYNLGSFYGKQGIYDQAIVELKKAIHLNPLDADTYGNLGIVLMQRHLYSEAEVQFKKAIELQPQRANHHFNLGNIYWLQNKQKEAVSEWRKTLNIDPNHTEAKKLLWEVNGVQY